MTNAKFRFLKWTTLRHRGIDNKNIIIEEITNKRGQASYVANYVIFTSTVCSLYHKLTEKGINVSIGQVLNCASPSLLLHISKENDTMFVQNLFKHKNVCFTF